MAPSSPMIAVIGIPRSIGGLVASDLIGIPLAKRIGARTVVNMLVAYILQSDKDGSYYIGSTENVDKRLIKHNKGYSRYTKSKRPWKLIYKEEYQTLSEAKKREYYLKSLKSKIAIEKLIKSGAIV